MSKDSSLNRVLNIIKDLNNGKTLNLSNLALRFDVSDRTIRRDINSIKNVFDEDFIQKNGENIFTVQKNLLSNSLSGIEIATFKHIINSFNQGGIPLDIPSNLKDIVKKTEDIYDVGNKPLEVLNNKNIIKELEKSIKYSYEIKLKYKTMKGIKKISYKPYKIKMLNENFYLLGTNLENDFFMLRVNLIENVSNESKTFYKKQDIVNFIRKIQTPFSNPNFKESTISLEIDKSVSKYFKMKSFLPSQEIIGENDKGNLLVNYTITHFREIEDFIIQWMPNVKILNNNKLKNRIKKLVESKLNSID